LEAGVSDDKVALLRNSLKASEELVRAQAAHIKKLEVQLELFKAAYQAASKLGQRVSPSSENSVLVDILEQARPKNTD
jgi:ABC-type uncharacterized transport system substrate-binding protein